jgi:hypothetical protein
MPEVTETAAEIDTHSDSNIKLHQALPFVALVAPVE